MAELGYATQPNEYNQHVGASGFPSSIIASIIQVAGAGFRLSLLLNAIAAEMANADHDIRNVAKGISLFSLMLKQVGKTMEEGRTIASQGAIDTATEIKEQSEKVFEEIRGTIDFTQGRDEKGRVRSITIVKRVKWYFKKQKVQYLLGQLESLKLSLSIMLQVLQMGQTIATTRDDPSKTPLRDKALLQEKAEIQSMMVVQHWSLVELRKLYALAEQEAKDEPSSPLLDDPPPSYDAHRSIEQNYYAQRAECDLQPTTEAPPVPPKLEVNSQMVKYQEKPLHQLDASFTKALARENHVLNAPVYDIVDHLLGEWTRVPEFVPRSSPRSSPPRDHRQRAYYVTDSDSSDSEFERSELTGGRYIEALPRRNKKNVRFHARVESDPEDGDWDRQQRRPPRKHILHSEDDDSTSDSESASPPPQSHPPSRRASDASPRHSISAQEQHDRNRRPYASGGLGNVPEDPGRPVSRGIPMPPMPMPTRPMATPNQQHWPPTPQGTPSNSGFRLPSYHPPPSGPPRLASGGPYAPPPGYMGSPSPQTQAGGFFPQQRPPGPPGPPPGPLPGPLMAPNQQRPPQHRKRHHRHTEKEKERERVENEKAERAKESSKNLKRGLFGGAAVAGILDMLQGLEGL